MTTELGAPNISMVWSRGVTPFYDLRVAKDSMWFAWDMEMDFRLNCILMGVDAGHYEGACKGPYGGIGLLTMVPPGKTLEEKDIDPDALLNVWNIVTVPPGWDPETAEPEPEPEYIDLDTVYAEEVLGGSLVDMGGYRINQYQAGDGDITVVFEAGMGDDLRTWSQVLNEIALPVRLLAYDRAGLGYSEPSPNSRTPEQMATELHRLLREAGVPPPYVLVSHAEGSYVVRRFAALYPAEVQGMVLVDPRHEQQGKQWSALSSEDWETYLRQQAAFQAVLPEPVRAEYEAFAQVWQEGEVPGLGGLPDVPVVVLTAMMPVASPRWIGETREGQQATYELHKTWVEQASNASHLVTETNSTYIHREAPALIIEAIQQVLDAIQEK